ncbi:MAG: NAD(P)/FAD-dependent oxidoreductase [Actinobacteria bacterium]|nr:NAD(P)/FAD-dependent oxidoreductase [Actinomycetota bacterium]MCL6104339.1 NAD(P)/FAD-dependent oxidoreductase [Actinomycetota bacterium]
MEQEHFDVVIIGGGHNGSTLAAYLAKSGVSVCILEARSECGGGQENTEVRPGFKIDPHATFLYGGAAPGFDQLELFKYGMRMVWYSSMAGLVTLDGMAVNLGGRFTAGLAEESIEKYAPGVSTAEVGNIFTALGEAHMRELLRALFWTPPYPLDVEVDLRDMPWWQVFRKYLPGFWTEELVDMSYIDFLEAMVTWEPLRVVAAFGAWYCGAHPAWDGMLLPSLGGTLLYSYSSGSPRGGMHTYAHAIIRCALAHGARIITNAPVEEIIVKNGRAVGVRLSDDAVLPEKTIWADKAVVSGVDVKQTFLRLVGKKHLDVSFVQKVGDVSLKGGSLFVMHVICRDLPNYHGMKEPFDKTVYPATIIAPADSMDFFWTQTQDAYSHKIPPAPTPEHLTMMICNHDLYDPTRSPEGYHLLSPIYIEVPPPQYDVTGPEGINRHKSEITKAALNLLGELAPNMKGDNIVDVFVNTPYDSEFRNAGMSGGNWYGARQSEDQWFSRRPLPELSRYRTPIDRLYLCNHTSHPGGLCLMAVPYNLMHILIEDGIAEPGSWWYPSDWWLSEGDSPKVEVK